MTISIISINEFVADILRQHITDMKVCTYSSPERLFNALNLNDANIIIIDSNRELTVAEVEFIKYYSALTMVILLVNDFVNYSDDCLGGINMIQKPFLVMSLYNLIDKLRLSAQSLFQLTDKIYFNHTQRLVIELLPGYVTKEINLTEKESKLLYFLILQQNSKQVSKEKLLNEIFGYKDVAATHTLETHIYRLRQKIPQAGDIFCNDENGYSIKLEGMALQNRSSSS